MIQISCTAGLSIYSIFQEICTLFFFAVLCCGYTLTDFPTSIRFTSLALWQSNDCPNASNVTLMNMDKYFMWIHYERLRNHKKAKHNKTVCIFLGIYCRSNGNINLLHSHNPIQLINVQEIRSANTSVSDHLLFLHSVTGCDTTSALYMRGKTEALDVMMSHSSPQNQDVFTSPRNTHDDIVQHGKDFLLQLCSYFVAMPRLLIKRYIYIYIYDIQEVNKQDFPILKLETLPPPPTSAVANYYSYRVYHTVQQWTGHELLPLDWGWRMCASGLLVPIETDKPVVPDNILRMISCGCKMGCGCRKKGIHCSVMCSQCYGLIWSNITIDVSSIAVSMKV